MRVHKNLATIWLLGLILCGPATAESDSSPALDWQFGSAAGAIGSRAKIDMPAGYGFLGAEDTKKFMVLTENIPGDGEYVIAPTTLDWFAIFRFNAVGYVKDNQELDADKLLETMKEGTKQSNQERERRGWGTMTLQGWAFRPRYDSDSHLLEWAFLGKDDQSGDSIVNYNTRILGRNGVMEVVLVASPSQLDSAVPALKNVLKHFHYLPGEKYADYRKGDKIAKFGLAALITGGVAAVATKKGFWAVIGGFLAAAWKFVAAGVAAFFAWVGSLFRRKS